MPASPTPRPPRLPPTRPRSSPTSPDAAEPVRLRLDIAYDGTDFAGWAVQEGQRTVAGVLDETLSTVFRVPVRLFGAGRTDSGVHASGQVAHVDIPADALQHAAPRRPRPGEPEFAALLRRLGKFLPNDVRVRRIGRAAVGFDARFSALRRHYAYRLSVAPYGVEPQQTRFVTWWPRSLDLEAMAHASRTLLGLHDFAAFCRHRAGATTIRELQRMEWVAEGDLLTAYVSADAFCWSMVRSLVGALLAVGEGRREPDWCATLLTADHRSSDFAAAPARGLTLIGVDYPPDPELASRTAVTRDVRTLDPAGD